MPKPLTPDDAVAAFEKFSPAARVILIPAMVGGMFRFDFDLIWSRLKPKIKPEAQDKALAALQMVERWAREAEEFSRIWNSTDEESDQT